MNKYSLYLRLAAAACEFVAALSWGGILSAGPALAWFGGGLAAFFLSYA